MVVDAPHLVIRFEIAPNRPTKNIVVDCVFFEYLIKELETSKVYLASFSRKHRFRNVVFILQQTKCDLVDYKWNERVTEMVRERCELDHALSWLSTLGGAFSALGDYFAHCATIAGKISVNQLKLGLRLGDPNIASRCRLYFSLSLIQQQRFKFARFIIEREFENARNATVTDERLIKMCKGIWAKLQYEKSLYRDRKKSSKNKNKKINL